MSSMNRRGSILILTVIGSLFILGICALVTDIGYAYFQKSRLQTAVNNAWRAGFDEYSRLLAVHGDSNRPVTLTESEVSGIRARVQAVFQSNGYSGADANALTINIYGQGSLATYTGRLVVYSTQTFGLFFARAMNFEQMTVGASRGNNLVATGTYDDGGGFGGIVPIGIPHADIIPLGDSDKGKGGGSGDPYSYKFFSGDEGFTVGKEYVLRLGQKNNDGASSIPAGYSTTTYSSNHGSLDLDQKGGGANEYRNYFINGYSGVIDINDRLNLKSGQMDGPVDFALEARCELGTPARRVTIPIVDIPPENHTTDTLIYQLNGTSKPVRVIGFAIFDLILPGETTRAAELGDYEGSGQLRGVFVRYLVHPNEAQYLLTDAP